MQTLRTYQPHDLDACLALFDSNVPRFFSARERADFEAFLRNHAADWSYQVVLRDATLVACGGYSLSRNGSDAHLCWGMVHARMHRQGLGTLVLVGRLDAARRSPAVRRVLLDTSQHTQAFYARFGFQCQRVTPDGYGPGLDRYDMCLALTR